jgi:DNA-binding beta-propeller fold protein YncE
VLRAQVDAQLLEQIKRETKITQQMTEKINKGLPQPQTPVQSEDSIGANPTQALLWTLTPLFGGAGFYILEAESNSVGHVGTAAVNSGGGAALDLPERTEPRSVVVAPRAGAPVSSNVSLGQLRVYILNTALGLGEPDYVDILDPIANSYDARVDLDSDVQGFLQPEDMEITDDGSTLVVAVRGIDPRSDPSPFVPSHLTIVDTATATRVRRINLPNQIWPIDLALAPDGRTAYVSTQERTQDFQQTTAYPVLIVDLQSNTVTGRIDLPFGGPGGTPGEIVITQDGALLFVLSALQFTSPTSNPGVYMIDTRTRTITAAIGGTNPDFNTRRAIRTARELAMHPHGTKVFVSPILMPGTFDQFGVGVIDTATGILTNTIAVPGMNRDSDLSDLAATSDGNAVLVYDNLGAKLTGLDSVTYEVIDQEPLATPIRLGALSKGP